MTSNESGGAGGSPWMPPSSDGDTGAADRQRGIDATLTAMRERLAGPGRHYRPQEHQLRELASVCRRLIGETASTAASPETLAAATSLVAEALALLEPAPHGRDYFGTAEASLAGNPAYTFFDYSPLVGPLSPISPPIKPQVVGNRIVATCVYQRQYEGPPGCLHGGLIAAGFDEVLGFAQALSGAPGMTGNLTISYRSPTPLYEEVTYEGWFDRVEGRKVYTRGTLKAGDRLCAEATGLFISFAAGKGLPPGVGNVGDRPE